MENLEDRIASVAQRANDLTAELAKDVARQIRNVWICGDGAVELIEDARYLKAKVQDDKKKLRDILRTLDELVKERDGIK